jgi:hypothetical protein
MFHFQSHTSVARPLMHVDVSSLTHAQCNLSTQLLAVHGVTLAVLPDLQRLLHVHAPCHEDVWWSECIDPPFITASHPVLFTSGEGASGTYWIGSLVGPEPI